MPEAAYPIALSYGGTDQGPRENNEDEFYCDDERGIYFVVDGMGGHAAGEQAAAIAKARLIGRLERATGTPEQRIREAITLANNAIYSSAESCPEWRGMACVLTVAVIDSSEVTVGHVGDSRLYSITPAGLEKITHDHSPVGILEDGGEITEAQALDHPRRNEVFRDVGSQMHQPDDPGFIDIYRFAFSEGSAFLLCSDGLSDVLSNAEISTIVNENRGDRVGVVRSLIVRAVEDGKDNVTAVFVHGDGFRKPQRRGTRTREPRMSVEPREAPPLWRRVAIAAALVLVGVGLTLAVQSVVANWPRRTGPQHIRVEANTGPGAISAALGGAVAGDVIEIAPGEYTDWLRLKNNVTLSATGATLRSSGIAVQANGVEGATVSGLQIRPMENAELLIGVFLHGGRVDLRELDIAGARRAGIEFSGDAAGTLSGSTIHDNAGPGILIRDRAAPFVNSNAFLENGAEAIWMPAPPAPSLLNENRFGAGQGRGKVRDVRVTGASSTIP